MTIVYRYSISTKNQLCPFNRVQRKPMSSSETRCGKLKTQDYPHEIGGVRLSFQLLRKQCTLNTWLLSNRRKQWSVTADKPGSVIPAIGTCHFRQVPTTFSANSVSFWPVPLSSDRILTLGFWQFLPDESWQDYGRKCVGSCENSIKKIHAEIWLQEDRQNSMEPLGSD